LIDNRLLAQPFVSSKLLLFQFKIMPSYPTRSQLPPCPDPEIYTAVHGKKGWHWRKKRGKGKEAKLNKSFAFNSQAMCIKSPASKCIRTAMAPYLIGLEPEDLHNRFIKVLSQCIKQPSFSYAPFIGQEIQPEHPLGYLLSSPIQVVQKQGIVTVEIPIQPGDVHRHQTLVSDFYLELVMVIGDPFIATALHTDSVTSPLYAYDQLPNTPCTLRLPLPEEPWLLLLKFCSLEGNELAVNNRHYGMKVVGGGG
jgi:hypothetical protein